MTLTCTVCDDLLGDLSEALAQLHQAKVEIGRTAGTPEDTLVLEFCVARQVSTVAQRRIGEHILAKHRLTPLRATGAVRDRRSHLSKSPRRRGRPPVV